MATTSGAGYSGTPLAKKLGIKDGHRLATVRAPDGFEDLLDLPPSVRLEVDPSEDRAFNVIVAFCYEVDHLEGLHNTLKGFLAWDGGLWVAWPKQSSPLATELKDGHVRSAGLDSGLVDNKVCALDQDWSGLRFVYRKEDRPKKGPRGS